MHINMEWCMHFNWFLWLSASKLTFILRSVAKGNRWVPMEIYWAFNSFFPEFPFNNSIAIGNWIPITWQVYWPRSLQRLKLIVQNIFEAAWTSAIFKFDYAKMLENEKHWRFKKGWHSASMESNYRRRWILNFDQVKLEVSLISETHSEVKKGRKFERKHPQVTSECLKITSILLQSPQNCRMSGLF